MKNIIIIFAFAFSTFIVTSCRETTTETKIIKEVKVETDTKEGILERTAKKVDKEVNQEVDKAIDKIGNDD